MAKEKELVSDTVKARGLDSNFDGPIRKQRRRWYSGPVTKKPENLSEVVENEERTDAQFCELANACSTVLAANAAGMAGVDPSERLRRPALRGPEGREI